MPVAPRISEQPELCAEQKRQHEQIQRAAQRGAPARQGPHAVAVATVSATGVRWPLHHEVLGVGTSRGISNEAAAAGAEVGVEVDDGLVLVLIPDSEDVR